MTLPQAVISPEQVAETILGAARQRFEQFGYGKTTMAEIAADCGMSAANLYRYFENKLEIGVRLASRCLDEEESALARIVEQSDLSAVSRLKTFLIETLEHTHRRWSQRPRLNELVEAIAKERLDFVRHHQSAKHTYLVRLLTEGIANGEFDVIDPEKTAWAILAATTLFDVPLFMHLHTREEFESMLNNVFDLMLRGLLKR